MTSPFYNPQLDAAINAANYIAHAINQCWRQELIDSRIDQMLSALRKEK